MKILRTDSLPQIERSRRISVSDSPGLFFILCLISYHPAGSLLEFGDRRGARA